jgi:hypothetical protein
VKFPFARTSGQILASIGVAVIRYQSQTKVPNKKPVPAGARTGEFREERSEERRMTSVRMRSFRMCALAPHHLSNLVVPSNNVTSLRLRGVWLQDAHQDSVSHVTQLSSDGSNLHPA